MFPGVSFALENISEANGGAHERSKTRILSVPKTNSTLATFRHMYGKALAVHVAELDEQNGDMRLEGFISLHGAHSKAYQYLFINKHHVAVCDIHKDIEAVFAASTFSKHAFDEMGKMASPKSNNRRSPRKTEKKPVYVLNITIPPRFVDNCFEPAKAVIQLQTERGRNAPYATAAEAIPRNLPCIQEGAYPDTTHVVWKDPATGERFIIDSRTGNSYPELAPLIIEAEGSSAVATSRARKTLHAGASSSAPRSSGIPAWIAEALTENDAYRLAERRITTLPTSSEAAGLSGDHAHHPRGASRGHAGTAWDASRIGRFTSAGLGAARVLGQVDRKFIACVMRTSTQGSTETSTEASTEASTSEVEDAGAVRDAPCPDCGPGSRQREGTLVLIDQHAADERVRVERFLRELCEGFLMSFSRPAGLESDEAGVRTRTLVPPVNVLLTGLEAKTLEQSLEIRTAFARWGVVFAKSPGIPRDYAIHSQEDESYSQIAVEAVPEVIADKLLAGGELRELVKGHLAKLEKDGLDGVPLNFGPAGDDTEAHAHGWQRALRYCPRGLIDLANSKACRGAIMFNDALTLEQCRTLLDGLAETALPFQCAHGRPSLVPLVEIRGEGTGITRAKVDWTAFMGRSTA
ncbi:hypothetical protein BN946_scf185015.g98 [Trametes cinnabarina]|uniref:MutL C-terminal dimerisation domain-containing protein n=1 Tax=Pycnoporus cinnabarinus TaxID=5643 RepID=A0A060SHA5_PYCCI|nr:hypothetical protein BN946_scf185015.g98 [Trametes cinnabarina]